MEKLDKTARRRWMKRVSRRSSDRELRHAGNAEPPVATVAQRSDPA
jgi:hypothetical protein